MRLSQLFSLRKIIQQTFSRRRPRRAVANQRQRSVGLQLEALEDRWLPSTGVLTLSVGGQMDRAFASFQDDSGDIVVAGGARASGETENFMAARYQAHGILDGGFGDGGATTTDLNKSNDERAVAAAAYSGGRIVLGGSVQESNAAVFGAGSGDFALVRYDSDGSLDSTFGKKGKTAGTATADFGGNDRLNGLVVLPDGSIVAAGFTNASGTGAFALAKFTASGFLDTSFGASGLVQTAVAQSASEIRALTLHEGNILAVGFAHSSSTAQDVALARYDLNGELDTTFGNDGIVVTNLSPVTREDLGAQDRANAVAVDATGNILIAGHSSVDELGEGTGDYLVARFTPDGVLDTSFGNGGTVQLLLSDSAGGFTSGELNSIAIQSDDKIVVSARVAGGADEFHVARLLSDGTLDTSFDGDGRVVTPILGSATARSLLIQSDGKIVVSGHASDNTGTVVALARYNPDGSLDTTFGEPLPPSPGITVTPTTSLETSEDGDTASFTVALDTQPTHNVIIWLTSLDETEGVITGGDVLFTEDGRAYLLFTPENWDVPQEVIITGVDDDVKDGDQDYAIELTFESDDTDYDALDSIFVELVNKDNDSGGKGGGPKK